METRKTSEIVYRQDLYPRQDTNPAKVQEYAENIDVMPPIEINQHNELIDGWHRWTAHRKVEKPEISVIVTETVSDAHLLELAIIRNATHGQQLKHEDKKALARRLYLADRKRYTKDFIAGVLSVTSRHISSWVSDIDKAEKEAQDKIIQEMWLACYTDEQIGAAVDLTPERISQKTKDYQILEKFPKLSNLSAMYSDNWEPELYDIWNFAKKTNEVKHYGNTEVRIVDNLLYAFTQPFDIIIDPFAGGGSTIDICKKRLRRYWASDRAPIVEREKEIRKHDVVTDGISGPYHWKDVALVYLDPPYWKQAAGKYSHDSTDLANMTIEDFTKSLIGVIESYASKMRPGSHIACIISPTQWPNEDKSTNYHDIDLACGVRKKAKLVRRIVCPYSTEQYNGTQVNIAKELKLWMVLSRTMLVWEVQ